MSSKSKKWIAIGATCVAIGVVAVSFTGMMPGGSGGPGGGFGGMAEEETAQTTVVETTSPTIGNINVTGSYVGTVEPNRQVTVYPKVAGEVLTANFSVGDTVQAGEVLFTIDSTDIQYSIAQSQAELASKKAAAELSLEKAQEDLEVYNTNLEDGYNSTLLQAENAVVTAENALQQANIDYRTARQNYNDYVNGDTDDGYSDTTKEALRNTRINAELKVESAQTALENAKASLEAAQKAAQDSGNTAEHQVRSAELGTDFSSTEISLQKLQSDLGNYTITAPISGVVEQRNIDPYDMASTQTAAYVISNKEAMTVSFNVAESVLSYIQIGDVITLEKNGQTCAGVISEISTMVDGTSGLYTIKATVENAPFEMHSGSTIKLYASTQNVENELMVPIDAIYYDNGTPYVYVFRNNTAVKTIVETGISDSTYIQIISGLTLSDDVIITWSASLYDGAEVNLPGTTAQSGQSNITIGGDIPEADRQEQPGTDLDRSGTDSDSDADEGGDTTPAGEEEAA